MMTRFSELPLDPKVLSALDGMGFTQMTPVQAEAIPKLLQGTDFLGQAPTGTGKTAAFGIPLISRLTPGSNQVDALILCPTRELAQQIAEELNRIGKDKGIRTLPIYGGESVFSQKDELRTKQYQIVVGTPGRVMDHMRQLSLDTTTIRHLVLDEADEMLDMGFLPDIEAILKQLPMGRETWLFSATMPPEIRRITEQYLWYPQEVKVVREIASAENITQYYVVAPPEEKHRVLRSLLKGIENPYLIIFCQTKRDVFLLARKLRDYFPLDSLHGNMTQSERDKVMEAFRNGEIKMLVATDIVARGIDVESLTHVINYDPPNDPESYVHRIGRTARKGETGIAVTFFAPDEKWALEFLQRKTGMTLIPHPDNQLDFLPGESRPPKGGRGRGRGGTGGGSRGGRGGSGRGGSGYGGGSRNRNGQEAAPRSTAQGDGGTPSEGKRPRRRRPRKKAGASPATPPTA